MRSEKSKLISRALMLAIAVSLLPMTACTSVPTKLPSDIPTIVSVPRQKPLLAMQPIEPPLRPTPISHLSQNEQAMLSQMFYDSMTEFAGKCYRSRAKLIDWIDGD